MEKKEKDDTVTEKNVDKYIIKAFKNYQKKNLMVDFWFWRISIPIYRSKVRKKTAKEIFSRVEEIYMDMGCMDCSLTTKPEYEKFKEGYLGTAVRAPLQAEDMKFPHSRERKK